MLCRGTTIGGGSRTSIGHFNGTGYLVAEILSEVERHMKGLTHGIDDTMVDQLPLRLQQYTIRVLSHINRLLLRWLV